MLMELHDMDEARQSPSILLDNFSDERFIETLTSEHLKLCQQLYLIYPERRRQFREVMSQEFSLIPVTADGTSFA